MVEDNPTDVIITREALSRSKLNNDLHVVEDGVEAMAFLRREGPYASKPRPDLILLDWNLPKKSGREVLSEVKSDPDLKIIPVVVLTSSKSETDVIRAYSLYANCYITKPVDFEGLVEVVASINNFWFSIVTLPSGS